MDLPVGKHEGRALEARLGYNTNGKEFVAVTFEVDYQERTHQKVWYGYFTEKTSPRIFQSLVYCGWKGNLETFEGLGDNTVELVFEEDRDLQTGQIKGTRIAWVNKIGGGALKNPFDAQQTRQFAAANRSLILEALRAEGVVPAGRPPARQAPQQAPQGHPLPQHAPQWHPRSQNARPPITQQQRQAVQHETTGFATDEFDDYSDPGADNIPF